MNSRAEKLAVLALARATQAARAAGFDDSELVQSLQAVRESLDSMANDLLQRIHERAPADHEHAQYALESAVAERLTALSAEMGRVIAEGLNALRTDFQGGLERVSEQAAPVGHSHDEFGQLSDAVKAVQEALGTSDEASAEARQALQSAIDELADRMTAAVAALDDDRITAELRATLRLEGLTEKLDGVAAALPGKAAVDHAHPDLTRGLDRLAQRLADLAQRKADADHQHVELEALISATRAALAAKADQEHGEHLTTEAVRALVQQAKPKDGKDGDSINPRPNWRPGQKAEKFDLVRHRNATWLALRDTSQVPSMASPDWFLVAADGTSVSTAFGGGTSAAAAEPDRIEVEYVDESSTLISRKVVDRVETRYTYDENNCPQYAATAPEGTALGASAWTVIRATFDAAMRPVVRDRLTNVPADDPDSLPWPS